MLITLTSSTGLPKDDAENVLWLTFPTTPTVSDFLNATGRVSAFYNTVASGATNKIGAYISGERSRTTDASKVTFSQLTLGPPPVLAPASGFGTFTLPAAYTGSIPLPQQLAICSSYGADASGIPEHGAGGTRPAARYRGRFYVGPVNSQTLQEAAGTTAAQTVSSVTATDLAAASKALRNNLSTDGFTWCVYSRTDGLLRAVTHGWVDDEWDVQRRRAIETTGRHTWS
jgi:hypothetical protein